MAKTAVSSANVAVVVIRGGLKVGGVGEVEKGAEDATLRDSCMDWEEVREFIVNFDSEVSVS
jgi:hypothetical protein